VNTWHYSPTETPSTVSMDAGAAQALVHLGVAAGVMGSLRAHTAETIHIIDAGGTLATGIGGALIDVNVTSLPCREGGHITHGTPRFSGNRPALRDMYVDTLQLHRLFLNHHMARFKE
jgi:hypothetical protein